MSIRFRKVEVTVIRANSVKGERRDGEQARVETGGEGVSSPAFIWYYFQPPLFPFTVQIHYFPLPIHCQMNQEFTLSIFTSHLLFLPCQFDF